MANVRLPLINLLATFIILPTAISESWRTNARQEQAPSFRFASIGDSWAAGPSTDPRDTYGGLYWDHCYRHKAAWEALMADDDTWTYDPINFQFAACSGAILEDMTEGSTPQVGEIGTPQLLTIQLGGNNAHFSDIARACIYIGDRASFQKDYPDPDGVCSNTIGTWEQYLDGIPDLGEKNSFYFDHHKAMQKILLSDHINNDNVHIYVVSEWCNEKSFGILKKPKLNHALRSKLNELVRKMNKIITQSVSDLANPRVKYLDPSPLFENHRFCEPHHTLNNQYFLNDVWFWNLSSRDDDPDYLAGLDTKAIQTSWAQEHMFPNGTTATEEQLLKILNGNQGSNPSSSGRTFHPKDGGHRAIKEAMLGRLRNDQVPGVKQAPPPNPPPLKQPYESGPIHIHVNEFWGCLDDEDNLSVEVIMSDSNGEQIGYLDRTQAGASAAARMGSRLEDFLIISPQWAQGGYIQFQLGNFWFNTNSDRDDTKPVHCTWGGFDPREGPTCVVAVPPGPPIYFLDAVAINQVDCWFPAPDWNGGRPSDGSSLHV